MNINEYSSKNSGFKTQERGDITIKALYTKI